jgi:hypothetical protein
MPASNDFRWRQVPDGMRRTTGRLIIPSHIDRGRGRPALSGNPRSVPQARGGNADAQPAPRYLRTPVLFVGRANPLKIGQLREYPLMTD